MNKKQNKLIEALKINGFPYEIPDCSRDDLPQLFLDLGFKKGAEIGVYKAEYSQKIAEKGLEFYAIDPWLIYEYFENPRGQKRMDFLYEHSKRVLSPYPNATIIRKTSMEAVKDFKDKSLDFVYIDANHEFKYIAEDLAEWSKKVRSGGIVSGHDYFYLKSGSGKEHWHVAYVLNAYLKAFGIKNFFVLGSKNAKEGEKRDKWRSWMFIKP